MSWEVPSKRFYSFRLLDYLHQLFFSAYLLELQEKRAAKQHVPSSPCQLVSSFTHQKNDIRWSRGRQVSTIPLLAFLNWATRSRQLCLLSCWPERAGSQVFFSFLPLPTILRNVLTLSHHATCFCKKSARKRLILLMLKQSLRIAPPLFFACRRHGDREFREEVVPTLLFLKRSYHFYEMQYLYLLTGWWFSRHNIFPNSSSNTHAKHFFLILSPNFIWLVIVPQSINLNSILCKTFLHTRPIMHQNKEDDDACVRRLAVSLL